MTEFSARIVDSTQQITHQSDIYRLVFEPPQLLIHLATKNLPNGKTEGFEIVFTNATAFRFLDELDLARYWASEKYPKGKSHILEVLDGGWANEETQLQGWDRTQREWLIATGNGCLSVFATQPPSAKECQLN